MDDIPEEEFQADDARLRSHIVHEVDTEDINWMKRRRTGSVTSTHDIASKLVAERSAY